MYLEDTVKVYLTTKGYEIYNKFYFVRYQTEAPVLKYYFFAFKDIMRIFGPHIVEGTSEEFFVDNRIIHV